MPSWSSKVLSSHQDSQALVDRREKRAARRLRRFNHDNSAVLGAASDIRKIEQFPITRAASIKNGDEMPPGATTTGASNTQGSTHINQHDYWPKIKETPTCTTAHTLSRTYADEPPTKQTRKEREKEREGSVQHETAAGELCRTQHNTAEASAEAVEQNEQSSKPRLTSRRRIFR